MNNYVRSSSMSMSSSVHGDRSSVRSSATTARASPNAAAQWGHAWSLCFSCTCRSRSLGFPKVLSHRGQSCARLLCLAYHTINS